MKLLFSECQKHIPRAHELGARGAGNEVPGGRTCQGPTVLAGTLLPVFAADGPQDTLSGADHEDWCAGLPQEADPGMRIEGMWFA